MGRPRREDVTRNRRRFAAALEARTRARLRPGHTVRLVCDGRVFDAVEAVIARARRTVDVSMYIWWPGRASDRVVAALAERAGAGVACRVLVDPVGSREGFDPGVEQRLREAGCEVRHFHPPGHGRARDVAEREHRKLVVADGREAVTGGFCIADDWLGDGTGPHAWRDTNAHVRGPAVQHMVRSFAADWRESGGERDAPTRGSMPRSGSGPGAGSDSASGSHSASGSDSASASHSGTGSMEAAFVSGETDDGHALTLTRTAVEAAERRLWLSSGYFLPDRELLDLMAEKHAEGVDVRILTAGPIHDLPPIRALQRAIYPDVLDRGLALWEYQPAMMHAKTVVVDDWLSVVGSINLDPLGLHVLEEGALVCTEPRVNRALGLAFAADLGRSRRVRRAAGWQRMLRPVARGARRLARRYRRDALG